MGITYIKDFTKVNKEALNELYGNGHDYYDTFEKSYLKVFAYEEDSLIGAVRIISEGYETALLVDLHTVPSASIEVKKRLVAEAEKELMDRRVMVYSDKSNLDLFEDLGYGRCKNAWTYFNVKLTEADFLPAGYRYENEFISYSTAPVNAPKNTEIMYKDGYGEASFEAINEVLTKAFGGRAHDVNRTKAVFENSQYAVTAFDGDKLVGVARAVSDMKSYATILNVAVDPEYQGLSIGKKIVLRLSQLIDADVIVLNTHPGAVGFYNKLKEYRRNKYVFEKMITSDTSKRMPADRFAAMFTPKGYRFPDEY